jgi:hypothetical protein
MALRVEVDSVNKLLLLRLDGPLTDESVAEFYRAIAKHWIAADARMGIVDFSSVTEFALSSALIRQLAEQEPCIPDANTRPRVIVAPSTLEYGLARMYQIMGEGTRPLLNVVHTLDEAFAELGVQSPQLEPLE